MQNDLPTKEYLLFLSFNDSGIVRQADNGLVSVYKPLR